MTSLQAVHGRIVDLRRHTNVHLYGRRPLGPTDRYELWIKPRDGVERKFTVNTRTVPARLGHDVSLIVTSHKVPQVLGLANWSTVDGVNYARTDAPGLHHASHRANSPGLAGGPGNRCGGLAVPPRVAGAAMTIRFVDQVRLAPRDRYRLALLTSSDPGDIVSFAQLRALMQRHRSKVRGVSRDAEFLRWLMDREWNRLAAGSGYAQSP